MDALKLRTFLLLSALSLGLFVTATVMSAHLPSPMPEEAVAGKNVWQRHNCVSCHTLFGTGGYLADDLTHVTTRETPSQVVAYLVEAPVMRPDKYRRHPALNKVDAENLVQYLEYVQSIPTLGWPPQRQKPGGSS